MVKAGHHILQEKDLDLLYDQAAGSDRNHLQKLTRNGAVNYIFRQLLEQNLEFAPNFKVIAENHEVFNELKTIYKRAGKGWLKRW